MQSSSYELNPPVADKRICMDIYVKFLHLRFGVKYPTNVKSAGYRFQLEASHVSSRTEELW